VSGKNCTQFSSQDRLASQNAEILTSEYNSTPLASGSSVTVNTGNYKAVAIFLLAHNECREIKSVVWMKDTRSARSITFLVN